MKKRSFCRRFSDRLPETDCYGCSGSDNQVPRRTGLRATQETLVARDLTLDYGGNGHIGSWTLHDILTDGLLHAETIARTTKRGTNAT
jgi:hypothetical protein